jgi:type VI secretion system protein VasG
MSKLCADPETTPSPAALAGAIRPELLKIFKPAFIGRLVVIPYYPVRDEVLQSIVRLKLDRIVGRMRANNLVTLFYGDDVVEAIANRCTEVESGARNVDTILTNTVLPAMSRLLLARMVEGEAVSSVTITRAHEGSLEYSVQ